MKRSGIALVLGLSLFTLPASAEPSQESYFGQTPPGLTPELFAPGVVSTDAVEVNSVRSTPISSILDHGPMVTPDGNICSLPEDAANRRAAGRASPPATSTGSTPP